MAKADAVQMENILKSVKFPAKKEELIAQVEKRCTDEQILSTIRQLPNQHYRSVNEVVRALETSNSGSKSTMN